MPGSAEGVTEYRAFDVTEFLLGGKNVLGAELGSGFYNSESWGSFYNRIPALMMRLEIEYRDGETYDFVRTKTGGCTLRRGRKTIFNSGRGTTRGRKTEIRLRAPPTKRGGMPKNADLKRSRSPRRIIRPSA